MTRYTIFVFLIIFTSLGFCNSEKNELTYIGAEKIASKNGLIPEWNGGLSRPPLNWNLNKGLVDPFRDDKLIEIIDKSKIKKYDKYLSSGLKELLKKYKNFKLYLYPTRRSLSYPKKIRKIISSNTLKQDTNLNRSNFYFIPHVIPKNGLQVIHNHLFRYQGGSIERTSHIFPVRQNGSYMKIGVWSKRVYADYLDHSQPNKLFYVLARFIEPRSLKGDILLVHEPKDYKINERSSWIYSAAQRRVRRAPDVAYDGVGNGSEGMITADQVDGFNGATDRYNWTLVGKKTLIVPYNTYAIGDKKVEYKKIIKTGSVNPSLMRYEYHRVWIIKATLKNGMRHIYKQRIFYIDEDSWSIVMEEVLSKKGDMWRVALHGLVQLYGENFPIYRINVYHDLYNKSYLVTGLDNEIKNNIKSGFRASIDEFQPSALRRLGGES